jgi:hypothetical protein
MNWALSMWDLEQFIRNERKYNDKLTDIELDVYEKVSNRIVEIMNEYNLQYPA